MHLANQRPGKPDKLSQGAHNQTSYPRAQWEIILDKRGLQNSRNKPGGACNPERSLRVEATTTEGNTRSKSKSKNI